MNLDKLSRDLSDIHGSFDDINAGGCGEFAKLLGNKFKENKLNFKYILISYQQDRTLLESQRTFTNIKEQLNDGMIRHENGYMICHIMIYHKGKFIDSTGVHNSLDDTKWCKCNGYQVSAILPQEILTEWCDLNNTWNDMFDRSQLNDIKTSINKLQLN